MTTKFLTEKELSIVFNYNAILPEREDLKFWVSEINGGWQINFSIPYYEVCALHTRREPNIVRTFSSLKGVVQFLKKIGVKEFNVIIC